MKATVYQFSFGDDVALAAIEASLLLAIWSCEALHGECQVHLDAAHHLDAAKRTCIIDAGTAVGHDLNKLFVAFLRREYGANSFHVKRVSLAPTPAAA